MKIQASDISKYTLTDLDRLDPVTMILEDFGSSRGKLTIDCYGKAWTAFWGGIGQDSLLDFLDSASVDYIAGKLTTEPSYETDYDLVGKTIEYQYLTRIVTAVKEAVKELLDSGA